MRHRCLTDIAGPFYDTTKPFRNWSSLPYYQLDLPQPPYVDCAQLDWGIQRALAYLEQVHTQGYTGIVIDNLAHLITFESAPIPIYRAGSPYLRRASIYRAAFSRLFDRAAQLGMEVFVTTDMQWSTPPVLGYIGALAPTNPCVAEINRWALDELFGTFPQLSGLVVRVGEAGGAHNQEVGYASHLLYTSIEALRRLIATLLEVCESHERLLIMRTWSIGIGELGDLLWSPERYRAVFGGFSSPWLLASIKHGPSDFFRLLPHNPTLGLPGPRQIVELQNRREYELFGMTPSSIARLHQHVVRHAEAANAGFAGVWAWNSTGGWGGGHAALGTAGWSAWTELSSALTAALIQDSNCNTQAFIQRWCVERFGDPFGPALAAAYIESEELIEQGWYSGTLPNGQRTLGALYVPSLLWVWWMRPTASVIIWAYLAWGITNSPGRASERAAAAERLGWHAHRLATLAPGNAAATALAESVRYLADTIAITHTMRSFMENAFLAAWYRRRTDWNTLIRHVPELCTALAHYQSRWADNASYPPLELHEVLAFLGTLERAPGAVWYQARAACLLVGQLRSEQRPGYQTYIPGLVTAGILTVALLHRNRRSIGVVSLLAAVLLASPLRRHAIKLALPWLSRRLYLLPSIFFETGPAFTEWAA